MKTAVLDVSDPSAGINPKALAMCAEFGLTIIGKSAYPRPGETRAPKTLERILAKRGEAHLRLLLSTLAETENNQAVLDEALLWAVSDLVIACGEFIERRPSDWLELFDRMPVGDLQWTAQHLSGHVSQRAALAGMLFERFYRVFGDPRNA